MAFNQFDATIKGLALSVATDGVTVSLSPGQAYLPGGILILSQEALSVVVTGAVSAWRHFYLANVDGTILFEASAGVPADPYQGYARYKSTDQTRRYLGSLYFGTDGKTPAFVHSQAGDRANRIDFTPPGGIMLTTAALLNIGVAATATTLSAASIVPMTCRVLYCIVDNKSLATAYISTPDYGVVSATNCLVYVKANQQGQYTLFLNGSQQISYVLAGGLVTGGLDIRICGYLFDR